MTDQDQPQNTTLESSPPAEAQNTSSDENRVPQSRFNQVLQELNELKARHAQLEAADKTRREAEMSDLEKAQAAAQQEAATRQQLEAQLAAERKERREDRRDNALAQALAAAGALDGDATVLILKARQSDAVAALMDEGGALDSDAIKALVDKTKAERPQDFQSGGPGSPSNRGGQVPTVTNTEAAQLAKQIKQQYGYDLDAESLGKRIDMYKDIL